jgi:hypothetical protein
MNQIEAYYALRRELKKRRNRAQFFAGFWQRKFANEPDEHQRLYATDMMDQYEIDVSEYTLLLARCKHEELRGRS